MRLVFCNTRLVRLLERAAGLTKFHGVGDHWEHDPKSASGPRPEDGAKMRLEELRVIQTKPDPADPEERIRLFRHL